MKKTLLSVCLAALSLTTVSAQDEKPVTEKPNGEVVDLYRSSKGYYGFFGNAKASTSHGEWTRMVFADDGAVWLENPISTLYAKSWIKGHKAQADTDRLRPSAGYLGRDLPRHHKLWQALQDGCGGNRQVRNIRKRRGIADSEVCMERRQADALR